jgi:hypothetical protein
MSKKTVGTKVNKRRMIGWREKERMKREGEKCWVEGWRTWSWRRRSMEQNQIWKRVRLRSVEQIGSGIQKGAGHCEKGTQQPLCGPFESTWIPQDCFPISWRDVNSVQMLKERNRGGIQEKNWSKAVEEAEERKRQRRKRQGKKLARFWQSWEETSKLQRNQVSKAL